MIDARGEGERQGADTGKLKGLADLIRAIIRLLTSSGFHAIILSWSEGNASWHANSPNQSINSRSHNSRKCSLTKMRVAHISLAVVGLMAFAVLAAAQRTLINCQTGHGAGSAINALPTPAIAFLILPEQYSRTPISRFANGIVSSI